MLQPTTVDSDEPSHRGVRSIKTTGQLHEDHLAIQTTALDSVKTPIIRVGYKHPKPMKWVLMCFRS